MTLNFAKTPHRVVLVTGPSGAGRSSAIKVLEDLGFETIDNLPIRWVTPLLAGQKLTRPLALCLDTRNRDFSPQALLDLLDQLEKHDPELLYLDCARFVLQRRYSETRRKHPLTDDSTPLIEGIRLEREILRPLYDRSEKVIDTTDTTPHELRAIVRDFAGGSSVSGPLLLFESFGFKYGSPREADFIFDVRCLPNPHWKAELRNRTGKDPEVQEFLELQPMVVEMTAEIFSFLLKWLPGFVNENRSYITVAIGCTGGQHRSVYICEQLVAQFRDREFNAQVRHRQLKKSEIEHA